MCTRFLPRSSFHSQKTVKTNNTETMPSTHQTLETVQPLLVNHISLRERSVSLREEVHHNESVSSEIVAQVTSSNKVSMSPNYDATKSYFSINDEIVDAYAENGPQHSGSFDDGDEQGKL